MAEISETSEEFKQAEMMLNSIKQWYFNEVERHKGKNEEMTARIMITVLSQWASILAVDVGMSHEQFKSVCTANFEMAYQNAPKFG